MVEGSERGESEEMKDLIERMLFLFYFNREYSPAYYISPLILLCLMVFLIHSWTTR